MKNGIWKVETARLEAVSLTIGIFQQTENLKFAEIKPSLQGMRMASIRCV